MIARYRALFAVPGYKRLLLSSVLGRLPSGMFSLAILLLVHARTGSFLTAGLAVGAFTLAGALVGPALGAAVDRLGQRRILLLAAAAQAAGLVALVALADARADTVELVTMAALAGASQPPIAGCIRALWSQLATDQHTLDTAYALDATSQELIWTLGPLLVGAAALFSPDAGVLACAGITLGGTAFFASSKLSSSWQPPARGRRRHSALASPGLRALLCTVALAGVVIGAVEVGLTALAVEHGARWSAGPLLALFSVGSLTGGLLYSARRWQGAVGPRYRALLAAMAFAVAPLSIVHALAFAFALSVLAGLGLAPMLSAQFSLVGALAAEEVATEAFTWHRTATIAGTALGSSLGGSLIDAHGSGAAFALGCSGVVLAWALAEAWRMRIEPRAAAAATATL
ncbi:MAG TPA: MFS transporter [Solirubrobacteraceae bacterium]|nr:MFS transporter [Solirubrobacteraceae bacterium]